MSKTLLICFLSLFLVCENTGVIKSLKIEDDEKESCSREHGIKIRVNVDGFGDIGDDVSDDTKAFANAWKQACSTSQAVLLVPPDRTYKVNATRYRGLCAKDLIVQHQRSLITRILKTREIWLYFSNLTGVVFQGHGVIDRSCAKSASSLCRSSNGDDCISIVSGCFIFRMESRYCGPDHGISIGSLGKDNTTNFVTAVDVDTAFLKGTTKGLRIKTWQGGSGYVRVVRYRNVQMDDVANPIIIDQFYYDSPKSCINQTSAVEISQIMYENIHGTSKSPNAMKFACSNTVPCKKIVLIDIILKRTNEKPAQTFCNSANEFTFGDVQPPADCLMSVNNSVIKSETEFKSEYIYSEL